MVSASPATPSGSAESADSSADDSRRQISKVFAKLLLDARENDPLEQLPASLMPQDAAQAYDVQELVSHALNASLGPVVAWKVGAVGPEAEPVCAPIHRGTVFASGADVPAGLCRLFGAEAELAFRLAKPLPARPTGERWTREDVEDAIGSVHAVIEFVDTRFSEFGSQDALAHLADQASHGALVIGEGRRNWRDFTPAALTMKMWIDGALAYDRTGATPAGDPLRLLVWLANHASARGLDLPAETTIITGSTMGSHFVKRGASVRVEFSGLPAVEARIGTP